MVGSPFVLFFEIEKGQNIKQLVTVSYFALCFTARPRNFSESLNACLRLIRFSFVRYFRSFIHLTERRSALRSDTMSYRYISVSFLFRSFANSKTLAAIVSKNIRCSFSDNAATSGAPTVTTSSFVFSIFITSSRLFFEGRKNTPHYLGSKTEKSKGFARNFFEKFSFWLVLPLPDRLTSKIIHFYLRVA